MYKGRFILKIVRVRARLRVGVDEIITTALHEVHLGTLKKEIADEGKQSKLFVPFKRQFYVHFKFTPMFVIDCEGICFLPLSDFLATFKNIVPLATGVVNLCSLGLVC